MVRALWKPLQILGIGDPTSPAKNYKELIKIERRLKKWIVDKQNLMTELWAIHIDLVFLNQGKFLYLMMVVACILEV